MESPAEEKQSKSGLALSGGGYRATLFAVGSLWRLNELGLMKTIGRITSVSGGSITLGYLALNWKKLDFDTNGFAANYKEIIADPLQEFCSKDLDIKAGLAGLLSPFDTIGGKIAKAYDERLYQGALLKNLPSGKGIPEFVFYATNYDTGSSVRMTKQKIYDYKLGEAPSGDISLSQAVGASSAFPPLLSPVILDSSKWEWKKTKFAHLYDYNNGSLRSQLTLADGGLYDNMGLEAVWKGDRTSADYFNPVFVCDAGAPLQIGYGVKPGWFNSILSKTGFNRNWGSQLIRMSDVMTEQQRALRKRQLIENYEKEVYGGSYWGIATKIADYELPNTLAKDTETSKRLKEIPTRLTGFSEQDRSHLINWGYALTDAAIRKHVNPSISEGKQPIEKYQLD